MAKKKRANGNKGQPSRFAGTLFAASVILVCVLVFLLSDKGASVLGRLGLLGETAEPAAAIPSKESPIGDAGDAERAFFERAAEFGFDGEAEALEQSLRQSTWALSGYDDAAARVTLSTGNGEVTAFTLEFSLCLPDIHPGSTDPLDRLMDEWHMQEYSERLARFKEAFAAFAYAFDVGEKLTSIAMEDMMAGIDDAIDGATTVEASAAGMLFRCEAREDGGWMALRASLAKK